MGFFKTLLKAILDPSKANQGNLKGASGEAQVSLGLQLSLTSEYKVLNNLTVPTPKGTTQIDHVVVSPYGIHVIESKNWKGAIYGDEHSQQWTVFLGPKRYRQFNPILQNKGHIKALASILGLPESVFHSVIIFMGEDCRFKTSMPDFVLQDHVGSYIKSKSERLLAPDQVPSIVEKLQAVRLPDTAETAEKHVAQIKARFDSPRVAGKACPRCSKGRLVLRNGRDGATFLGCSRYPRCKHTQPA